MKEQKSIRSKRSLVIGLGLFLVAGPGCELLNQVQTITEEPSPTVQVARVNTPGTSPTRPASTPGSTPTRKPTPTETIPPSPTLPPMPKVKPLKMNSPEYGAQAFLWWRPETADRDLGLMRDAGLTWVKQQFAWRDIEGAKKGAFNWGNADQAVYTSNGKGIEILARIDNAPEWAAPGCFNSAKKQMGPAKNMQDWLDFLSAFVTRYKGRIRAYEIWNEPNLSREWCARAPNPSEYAALMKASYAKIKSIDPNAMIISAGMTPTTQSNAEAMPDVQFVEQMYTAMGNNSSGYFDVLGAHAAGFKAPPETSPDDIAKNPQYNHGEGAAGRIYGFRHAEDIRKLMVARGDSAKQVAVLEFGWTTDTIHPAYSWFKVDEQTQADYLVRAYRFAKQNWSPWIGTMFVIYMANPDWDKNYEEYWWAITEPNGTPRAGYVRLKAMAK
jgi:hypothetical protein